MAGRSTKRRRVWMDDERHEKGFEWDINPPQFLRDSRWYSKSSEPFLLSIWFAISCSIPVLAAIYHPRRGWYKTKEIVCTQMMIIYQISQPSWNRIGALWNPWHALSNCTPSSCLFLSDAQNKIAILSLGVEKSWTHRRWRCVLVTFRSTFNVINVKTLFTF